MRFFKNLFRRSNIDGHPTAIFGLLGNLDYDVYYSETSCKIIDAVDSATASGAYTGVSFQDLLSSYPDICIVQRSVAFVSMQRLRINEPVRSVTLLEWFDAMTQYGVRDFFSMEMIQESSFKAKVNEFGRVTKCFTKVGTTCFTMYDLDNAPHPHLIDRTKTHSSFLNSHQ